MGKIFTLYDRCEWYGVLPHEIVPCCRVMVFHNKAQKRQLRSVDGEQKVFFPYRVKSCRTTAWVTLLNIMDVKNELTYNTQEIRPILLSASPQIITIQNNYHCYQCISSLVCSGPVVHRIFLSWREGLLSSLPFYWLWGVADHLLPIMKNQYGRKLWDQHRVTHENDLKTSPLCGVYSRSVQNTLMMSFFGEQLGKSRGLSGSKTLSYWRKKSGLRT